ncbi:hypothetical protein F0344_09110 [Streptomyces finlayi]|uniref:Glycosyl hydrolase family 98 putative carbohydrate-binding module domain-containing protein n=1 Tax=Streptomyces finlayi TaxID=67296 RepID=A0A7G7BHC9_9ACTN|nr:endo-alpha-N-acetylgalactosaminidase family protein [Streptomyces finlayi]QNE74744.1 hypothetical protein F0344_09110 [Streptomyces finlayi]
MSRRLTSAGAVAAASAAVLALVGTSLPAVAAAPLPAAAAAAAASGTAVIGSAQLSVAVADDFPRVLSYTDKAGGEQLSGSTRPVTEVTLNGTARTVRLKGAPEVTASAARYTLTFPDLPGIEIDASIEVSGRATTFKVTAVRDTETFRVGTIDIPGHDLVSVGSTDTGAATAFTRLDPDSTKTADVFAKVTPQTAADAAPVGATYAILHTGSLAAAVESNASTDSPGGLAKGDNSRFLHQARKAADGSVRVGVRSGQWTYRGAGAPEPESGADLPWAKVVVTPDANGDRTVDWQDGAIAFRSIGVIAPGGDETADRVITHIPFNFASQATHPFLRTLDDVKRVSLATDGLGQLAVLKGYGSEGHDSAHPDYGGNYNKRAGGLKDLNKLLKQGKDWGATFGVHVNATESYPEAKAFSESLADKNSPGWNWLNQSYYMDQRRDINSGDLAKRFQQLRDETDPNLSFLYIDVYYSHGWIADKTMRAVRKQGWTVGTEWADKFERSSLWSHWANDLDYGGATNKGLNSQIIRFIRNGEKDVWNKHPVLGQSVLEGFGGWTGEQDFNAFYGAVWQQNLPAKFLQQEKITRWDSGTNDITFTGGVRGTVEDGKRTFYDDGRKVLSGGDYLLPWDGGKKLYHYSEDGGTSSWAVPGDGAYTVYELTDNGRVKTGTVKPADGRVTLTATAGRPYVLYPDHAPGLRDAGWGQGGPVADPGFNDRDLSDWVKTGTVTRDTDGMGRNSARIDGAAGQTITGLTPGERYTASAWLEIEPGKERRTTLSVAGKQVAVERSTVMNRIAASDWHDTYMQRVKVNFTAPATGTATLRIDAGKGTATVRADDVRVVANAPATKAGTIVYEDFEDVDQAWGPFLKGSAGGSNDPRTHIAQKNAPYTQAGWNGKLVDDVLAGEESLKTHEGNEGLVYRTAPATVPMVEGHSYEIEFDYQTGHAGSFEWVTGYDRIAAGKPESVETRRTAVPQARTTAHFSQTVNAGCGDTWTGLRMRDDAHAKADFILDGFTVTDLGPSDEQSACATLALTPKATTFEPGQKNEVTATFTNFEQTAASDVRLSLDLPEGWTAAPAAPVTHDSVATGAKATAVWQVTPPVDAAYVPYTLKAKAGYTAGGTPRSLDASSSVRTLQPPPTGDVWASDIDWTSAENGWGPVERDMSNGGQAAKDGTPLTIGGVVHAKGIGSHAAAKIRYYLGGRCTGFTADVGVDDAQVSRGTVTFEVAADGRQVAATPVLRAADPARPLTADVTGAKYVDLIVTEAGDGNGNDHADWGSARFHCGS